LGLRERIRGTFSFFLVFEFFFSFEVEDLGLGRLLKISTLDVSFGCRIVHASDSKCSSEGILDCGFTATSGFVRIFFFGLFLGVQEGRRLFVDRAGKVVFKCNF